MRPLKILFIVFSLLFTSTVLVFITKQEYEETYVVTLKDNTSFEAKRLTYYDSGITDIRKTNDERVQIPTQSIKQVKIVENK